VSSPGNPEHPAPSLPEMAANKAAPLLITPSPGQRLLGLDLGTKTIGLALGDPGHRIATPYATIARRKFSADLAELQRIVTKEQVGGLVLGLPMNMDGSAGPRVQATRAFARNIQAALPLPLSYWDERLSTSAVERMMVDADLSRARRAELVDKLAASYILQAYLDWRGRQPA